MKIGVGDLTVRAVGGVGLWPLDFLDFVCDEWRVENRVRPWQLRRHRRSLSLKLNRARDAQQGQEKEDW